VTVCEQESLEMDTSQAYTLLQIMERIADTLDSINDRLAEDRPRPLAQPTLYGYTLGQDELPSEATYRMAVAFLRGELHDQSAQFVPVVAWALAREIVNRYLAKTGARCELGDHCPNFREGYDHAHTGREAWRNVAVDPPDPEPARLYTWPSTHPTPSDLTQKPPVTQREPGGDRG
jgi:hypothetical protein